ncbi:CBL-interacting serine/threonine-protein kinase 24-like protein, partial [Tanacetum coccineum]
MLIDPRLIKGSLRGVLEEEPGNLLLDSEGKLKVSDFRLSALPQEGVELLYTTCGTPNYIVPETQSCRALSTDVQYTRVIEHIQTSPASTELASYPISL